ncbi:MAG: TetR/AcrR family transcriptional regulator [Microthrixaceae bacterium]|nr:TetR/AcrR family transcriptional regulator [Microthrixaceae bacterium]HPB46688.1 TetR/AcrR family transcriptional regulator [Microthrixaceae bacterium]
MRRSTARERIMDAVVACAERGGLGSFALEDVASQADVSRATIYSHFPGGRQQLIDETVEREVADFWRSLADEVRSYDDVEDRVVAAMMSAHRRMIEHALLQRLVTLEPGEILPALFAADRRLHGLIVGYLRETLAREVLRDGVDLDDAAEYLARMVLSHIGTAGRWDLTDRTSVQRLVRTQFLGGILSR